jgi:uncharacterized protein (DUF433 family)
MHIHRGPLAPGPTVLAASDPQIRPQAGDVSEGCKFGYDDAVFRREGSDRLSELHRITVDPEQCGGRPCIRSLRIRVKDVLDLLAAGASHAEILEDYPLLEEADIGAVLEFAARQSDHPVLRVA